MRRRRAVIDLVADKDGIVLRGFHHWLTGESAARARARPRPCGWMGGTVKFRCVNYMHNKGFREPTTFFTTPRCFHSSSRGRAHQVRRTDGSTAGTVEQNLEEYMIGDFESTLLIDTTHYSRRMPPARHGT